MKNKKVEILSPGGDPEAVKAAIIAGADAVYLGLKKFNARKRAENIDIPKLKELVQLAHSRYVKIFVTMNILLTESEIPEAVEFAAEIIEAGADAIIVQDAGFGYLLSRLFTGLEIHASTQMTTHNSLQIDFLSELGVKQLNFSRELSANELKPLINFSHKKKIKTEVFVHGAYCISCSGICYMSAFISAQPGNRGACLQPCRRQYSADDNEEKDYLLSLKDNNALPHAEELLEAGADTLKIEGRIKNFSYVYEVTSSWRNRIDELSGNSNGIKLNSVDSVFNRGFSAGYYEGKISPDMFIDSPLDQSQEIIGNVEAYSADKQILALDTKRNIPPGTRINIYTRENRFICGAIVKSRKGGNSWKIEIENQLKGKILKDQLVLKLAGIDEAEKVRAEIDQLEIPKNLLNVNVSGKIGEKLKAEFIFNGKNSNVFSESDLAEAQSAGLNAETLKKQFGRLGDTFFELDSIDISELQNGLFLPIKELNSMRREALEKFISLKPEFEIPIKSRNGKTREKKLALLLSDENEIREISRSFDGLIFAETTNAAGMKIFETGALPWIPPFVLDENIQFYIDLIEKFNPQLVISENSGIGFELGRRNINWIAGPQLNSTNGYSFETYKSLGNASGGFYSAEINNEQINNISVPEDFTTLYNILGPILLMTTRQCLYLKPGLCPVNKTEMDKSCHKGCENYAQFSDEKNIPFHILKSKGHLHRIYNDALLYLPEAVGQINADYFTLDLRSLPFYGLKIEHKLEIIDFFSSIINEFKIDQDQNTRVKKLIGKITRGNYLRGFETN